MDTRMLNCKKWLLVFVVCVGFVGMGSKPVIAAPADDFVITVKTDNTGTSSNTEFIIPTTGSGYNYDVDLDNDGTPEYVGMTGNTTCVFATTGAYTIRIQRTSMMSCLLAGMPKPCKVVWLFMVETVSTAARQQ